MPVELAIIFFLGVLLVAFALLEVVLPNYVLIPIALVIVVACGALIWDLISRRFPPRA